MKYLKSIFLRITADCKQFKKPILILIVYLIATQLIFHASCPSVILLGLPCPACGLTRAGVLLLTGHFVTAATYNPTIYLWALFLLYCFVSRYILRRRPAHCLFLAACISVCTMIYFMYALANDNLVPVNYSGIIYYLLSL